MCFSCKSSKMTGETIKYGNAPSGQISLKAGGYGDTKSRSINNAIENAFTSLLLRGVPGTNQSTPLLGKNSESVYSQHSAFFENFMKNDKEAYLIKKEVGTYKFLNVNAPSTNVTLLINLASLRSHLEQNGIIREFGL